MSPIDSLTQGGTMEAIRITQQISTQGITIPFDRIRQFQGTRVEIIILPDPEEEPETTTREDESLTGLFGIWKDDDTVGDVDSYVRNLRKGRRIYAD
jgi:hypothetical protein